MSAVLALEDGRVFYGKAFGARSTKVGEICFNTSMTGYQEVLTDPSYRGQIVAMTAPQIGNYGVNAADQESKGIQVQGFVVEECCEVPSNWRSQQDLDGYLKGQGIPGIEGIDTRSLTLHLRTRGVMQACLSSEGILAEEAVKQARAACYEGVDFVKEVTTPFSYLWDVEEDAISAQAAFHTREPKELDSSPKLPLKPLSAPTRKIVAYDLGIKKNILRSLRSVGCEVRVVPANTSAEEVLNWNPDGVFLSNGPGDPMAIDYVHEAIRGLIGKKPIFGICLGHQVLGAVFGASVFKLKFGHRGANHPVKDLRTGKVAITSQNHGYAVDLNTLPDFIQPTHVNLNDGTCAGLKHRSEPIFSVQYHPEAAPGPNDAMGVFHQFAAMVDEAKGS